MTRSEGKWAGLYLGLAGLTVLAYLGASRAGGFVGFPLDDAWIHQTYARNLGLRGEFAFVPGQPSAGSTSPLWSALLAVGYGLRIDYRVWTFGLGMFVLALNAWLVRRLVLGIWPAAVLTAGLAGAWAACEWHLAWSAVSGMETLLFTALALAIFVIDPERAAGWLGLAAGTAVLIRPDGLTLIPFALFRIAQIPARRGQRLLAAGGAFGLLFGAYLVFNQALAGAPWPNTFYAKQAEYALLLRIPVVRRWLQAAAIPFVGATALLLPGLVSTAWWSLGPRPRCWDCLWAAGWAGGLLTAYALRLPVSYQHGRYLIPVIPVVLALGMGGLRLWLRPGSARFWPRVVSRAWLLAMGTTALAFWVTGAQAYRRDVQIIETEMVASSHWINQWTEPDALIAAHDIGALGYFGGRRLLDLAGLVSPEVIPFIRDETQLGAWLDLSSADYLMTFPNWYPGLVSLPKIEQVFETGAPFSPAVGGENMAVYRWRRDAP